MISKGYLGIFSIILLCSIFSHAAPAKKKVTIVIYMDRSSSMAAKSNVFAEAVEVIASRLKETCGSYRIAVSGISYADAKQMGRAYLKIEDERPRFITDKDGDSGLALLKERMRWSEQKNSPFTDEVLFSSMAQSIENEIVDLVDSDLVVGLLLSDATPTYEDYTAVEALRKVYQYLSPKKYMAAGIVPDFSKNTRRCNIDSNSKGVEASDDVLSQPKEFFRKSGGDIYNICDNNIRQNVDEFMDLVLSNAQCLYVM